MKSKTKTTHIFTRRTLWTLLLPLMVEQLLNSLMGTIDTMMVSNIGPEAISAVSLVDSLNILVIQAFAALAAGGTIVCSQYIGHQEKNMAKRAAEQLVLGVGALTILITALLFAVRYPLLHLIFGQVEPDVMKASQTYFFYTSLSFPFIGLYNCGAAVFRAQGNSKTPMVISVISNFLNIFGNAFLIWVVHIGVAGAAISTLVSRVFCAVVVLYYLRNPKLELCVRDYRKMHPDISQMKRILKIGIPSGIENSMFQFGKLAIQSTVSTLGTLAIAAQAMTNILEALNCVFVIGVGIGLMTVVGQCIGAGRPDEARYYIRKLCWIGEAFMIGGCLLIWLLTKPITMLAGMEQESADLCFFMMTWITIVKPFIWVPAFVPAYGLRAAGDVRYSMTVSSCTMWSCRVVLCIVLIRFYGFGPMAVWIGMFTDWAVRSVFFLVRFHGNKWYRHNVIT